jgi:hypothetical protein
MGVKYNPFAGNLDIVDSPSGDFSDIDISGDLSLGTGTPTTTLQAVTPTANRTISFPDATGTVALVDGADGTVQYNEAGVLKGNGDFTVDPDWNDAAVTFTGLKLNVTNTASANGSNLLDLQVGGTSQFTVSYGQGAITFGSSSKYVIGRDPATGILDFSGTQPNFVGYLFRATAGAIFELKPTRVINIASGLTVATLPASPVVGDIARVTDGDSGLTFGNTVVNTGAGATPYLCWYNGTNWTVIGA